MILFGNLHPLDSGQKPCQTSNTDGTKTVMFQRRRISIRLTYNEPSIVALENFRITLHEILSRIIDDTSLPPTSSNDERSSTTEFL